MDEQAAPMTEIQDTQMDTPDMSMQMQVIQNLPQIIRWIGSPNIVQDLTSDQIQKISQRVQEGFNTDKTSRNFREDRMREAVEEAMMISTEKSYPWPKASNLKVPLLAVASIEFAAKVHPAIIQNGDIVKGKIYGKDIIEQPVIDPATGQPVMGPDGQPQMHTQSLGKQARADRLASFMNWQLMEDMDYWEEEMSQLSIMLPVLGCLFKKTYYNAEENKACSHYILPTHIYVRYDTQSLDTCRRVTHVIEMSKNDIIERQRSGIFANVELGQGDGGYIGMENYLKKDKYDMPALTTNDMTDTYTIYEQHCWYDLDGDGYEEPYVVTQLKNNNNILRVVPRYMKRSDIKFNAMGEVICIKAMNYFTKYGFLKSLDGGFYDMGLGDLLLTLNKGIDGSLNRLLDAGHLANLNAGFIGGGTRMKGGSMQFFQGEWKIMNNFGGSLRDNIVPLQNKEPSVVLFQLLQFLQTQGERVAAIQRVPGEDMPVNAPATTTLAMIEEGLTVFKYIFKGACRSVKSEIEKIATINSLYLNPQKYMDVVDDPQADISDFMFEDTGVIPVADPALVTNMQKMAKINFLNQFLNDPLFNGYELRKRILEGGATDNIDEILPTPAPPQPDPMAMQNAQLDLQLKQGQIQLMGEQIEDAKKHRVIQAAQTQADAQKQKADVDLQSQKVDLDAQKQQADIAKEPTSGAMVTAFIELAQAVSRGELSQDDAQNALQMFYGVPTAQAVTFFNDNNRTIIKETPTQELMKGIENGEPEGSESGHPEPEIEQGGMGPVETTSGEPNISPVS